MKPWDRIKGATGGGIFVWTWGIFKGLGPQILIGCDRKLSRQ